jgi:hypothetical protein
MWKAVRKWLNRSVRVTLKKRNAHGMTYDEIISLLEDLPIEKLVNREIMLKIDAYDLIMIIETTRMRQDLKHEEFAVKNAFNDPVKLIEMWGETDDCGMGQWLEVNVASGLNYSAIYKYDRCVRTGM